MEKRCLGCMETMESEGFFCQKCGYDQRTAARESYYLHPGIMLHGRYLIGKALGSGGFGITYLAYDNVLEKKVAIKEYFPIALARRATGDSQISVYDGDKETAFRDGMKKALEEARRLVEFQHEEEITQVYDFFEENNTAYIVMELLDGITLKDYLKRNGSISVDEALKIIVPVLRGLEKVHQKNIIHRDVAPDNVYLLKNGQVKLLDFGAARQVSTGHSKSYTVILKQGYAPAEQYQSGGDQGPWTDVYAAAATFYRMITGKKPPTAPDRRLNDRLVPPSAMGIKIDSNVENAMLNAMQVLIADRTRSAAEFEEALTSGNKVKRSTSTMEKTDLGGWPKWLKGLVAIASVAVIAGGAFLMLRPEVQPESGPEVQRARDGYVFLPNLVNLNKDAAQAVAEQYSLKLEITGTKPSDQIMRGCVMEQRNADGEVLEKGTEIKQGETIYIIISSGDGKAVIPDIRYMNQEAAKTMLSDLNLTAVNVETVVDVWAAEGTVVELEPAIGTEVEEKDVITMKVAGPAEEVPSGQTTVPNITGVKTEEAYKLLKQANLYLESEGAEYSREHPADTIISQNHQAGEAEAGTVIKVKISLGAKQVQMMNLVGMMETDARTVIGAVGEVTIGTVTTEYSDSVPAGIIISQSVPEGMVDEGTAVDLVVSSGKRPEETQRARQTAPAGGGNTGGSGGNSGQGGGAQVPETTQPQPQSTTAAPDNSGGDTRDDVDKWDGIFG